MKKFVIVEHEPLTQRLAQIWNIDALLERGVQVEYWDLSELIYPERIISGQIPHSCRRHISTLSELNDALDKASIDQTIFALELFPIWENRRIIKAFQDRNARCIKIDLYANTSLPLSRKERLENFFRPGFLKRGINSILWKIYSRKKLRPVYEFHVSSAKSANPKYHIHHPDYEAYMLEGQAKVDKPYILFVDVFYPLHPDHDFANKVTAEWVESYRNLMRSFFDFLEKKYEMPVVIAAHPKAKYSGEEFGNRSIFSGMTGNLVKYASMVVSHESNSLSYISIADKPVAFVYPHSYITHKYSLNYINKLAQFCGKQAYDLNETPFNEIQIETIPPQIRNNYLESFITTPHIVSMTNADIFFKLLTEN